MSRSRWPGWPHGCSDGFDAPTAKLSNGEARTDLPRQAAIRTSAVAAGIATTLVIPCVPKVAWADPPAVEGTRNLSLAGASRASTYGTNAVLINPAAMSFSQQFAIEPLYQLRIQERRHGIGIVVMDSLNNSRIGLGLGYLFMRSGPRISFQDSTGQDRELELSTFGHEAFASLSIAIVKRWLSIGIKPKYQYESLRYLDEEGVARNAHKKLNFFGLDTAIGLNIGGWVGISVVAYNVVGNHDPAYTENRELKLDALDVVPETIDHGTLPRVADYPLMLAHGASVFPLHHPDFSLNFDGTYDFTSYFEGDRKYVRLGYGGSVEYVVGPVPIRLGTFWDGRGPGGEDDVVSLAAGVAYVKPAKVGGVGVDVGFGFRQALNGPGPKETILGLNIGLRMHPDL